jgi:hypothetical protein
MTRRQVGRSTLELRRVMEQLVPMIKEEASDDSDDDDYYDDYDDKWLHLIPATGIAKEYDCFFKWHDEAYFGLGRMDSVRIFNKQKKDWTTPNYTVKQRNERHINNLKINENDSSIEDDSNINMK